MSTDLRELLQAASPPIPAPSGGLARAQGRARVMRRRATALRVLAVPLVAIMLAATIAALRDESRVRLGPADGHEEESSGLTPTTRSTAAATADDDPDATADGPDSRTPAAAPSQAGGNPQRRTATLPSMSKLAFRRGDELWTMRLDGTDLRRVTTVRVGFLGWTANGRSLLMWDSVSDDLGQHERSRVRLFDVETGASRVVLDHPGHSISGAEMSPDGRHFVYWAYQLFKPRAMPGDDTNSYLYITDADGRNARRIAVGREASWSPDSQRLAYECHHGYSWSCTIRADGTDLRPIGSISGPFAWSPDGRWLASPSGGVTLYRPDGSGERRLGIRANYSRVQWTPDGKRVVYARSVYQRDTLGRCGSPPCDEPPGIFATSIDDTTDHVRLTTDRQDGSPLVTFR